MISEVIARHTPNVMAQMFGEFLNNVATFFGTTNTYAGLFLGLVITVGFTLATLIAISTSENTNPTMLGMIEFLVFTVIFTTMGWYPIWTGSILGLAIALLGAFWISKIGTGK